MPSTYRQANNKESKIFLGIKILPNTDTISLENTFKEYV